MRIFDENKINELSPHNIDFEKGYLIKDKLFIRHHNKIEAKKAMYIHHTETLPNGSVQIWKELVEPEILATEGFDEYEDIQVFVLYNDSELKEKKEQNFREKRKKIFTEGFEPYKINVQYGIEIETEEQHQEILEWYQRMLDKDDSALENIPERIRYYISKEVE